MNWNNIDIQIVIKYNNVINNKGHNLTMNYNDQIIKMVPKLING